MKVSELVGEDLDYWVAKLEGWEDDRPQDRQMKKRGVVPNAGYSQGYSRVLVGPRPERGMQLNNLACFWSPSTMWHVGGPIIKEQYLSLEFVGFNPDAKSDDDDEMWQATYTGNNGALVDGVGPTPLIAAMRCYVEAKFGPEVPAKEQ